MVRLLHNANLSSLAKKLRSNPTSEERKLWFEFLHDLPLHFCRQKVIGNYIADFYCASVHIVIELDGSQHFEEDGLEYDKKRDEFLNSLGLTVVRYSNSDINKNFDAVCRDILIRLGLEQ